MKHVNDIIAQKLEQAQFKAAQCGTRVYIVAGAARTTWVVPSFSTLYSTDRVMAIVEPGGEVSARAKSARGLPLEVAP